MLTAGTTERGLLAKGHATISGTRIKHQKLLPPSAGNLRWETQIECVKAKIRIMYPKCHKSHCHVNTPILPLSTSSFGKIIALLLVAIVYSKSQTRSKKAPFSFSLQMCSRPLPTGIPFLQLCHAPAVRNMAFGKVIPKTSTRLWKYKIQDLNLTSAWHPSYPISN